MKFLFTFCITLFIALTSLASKQVPSPFYNQFNKIDENNATVFWSLKNNDGAQSVVVRYRTEIDDKYKQRKKDWFYSEELPVSTTKYTISDLKDVEKYVWQVGVVESGKDIQSAEWSSKKKFKTKRAFGIMQILIMIGALGLFMYGMKVMSEGLQQNAGNKLRKMLGSITSNRLSGVLTGFGITSIVQSSSVTTVMTVSFVNAGLLTLTQSAGVMLGGQYRNNNHGMASCYFWI